MGGSCSQAPFCLCTRGPISVWPKETFTRLHYLLRGLCPIETVCLRLFIGPSPTSLTFQHWPSVSRHTWSYAFVETCVFGKQLPRPSHCDPLCEEASLLPKLQGYFVKFLRESCLLPLGIPAYPFVSILGTCTLLLKVIRAFSRSIA
ncbi:hypothetical protein Golax_021512 [Gossypium laxum]|uniref:Uncharacterized protein n=1 Tax=Gossypium laxum TaxID=34288 RepID=A0A7J9ALB3_9ROSI|nr:hypothetical protein [Gossypium laxum]